MLASDGLDLVVNPKNRLSALGSTVGGFRQRFAIRHGKPSLRIIPTCSVLHPDLLSRPKFAMYFRIRPTIGRDAPAELISNAVCRATVRFPTLGPSPMAKAEVILEPSAEKPKRSQASMPRRRPRQFPSAAIDSHLVQSSVQLPVRSIPDCCPVGWAQASVDPMDRDCHCPLENRPDLLPVVDSWHGVHPKLGYWIPVAKLGRWPRRQSCSVANLVTYFARRSFVAAMPKWTSDQETQARSKDDDRFLPTWAPTESRQIARSWQVLSPLLLEG